MSLDTSFAETTSVALPGTVALVHDLLDDAAAEVGDAIAVRDAFGAWSYLQTVEASQVCAAWLRAAGVGRGDRVVAQLPTTRELVALMFGVVRLGAIFVPLNPAMKQFHLRSVVDNCEPALVITDTAGAASFREVTGVPVHDITEIRQQIDNRTPVAPVHATVDSSDVAVLVYTSGSTAAPKAVVCPHRQIVFAVRAINAELDYRPTDVVFCRFPMSWDYGLYKVLMSCLGRCEIVLAGDESDLSLVRRMRETGATIVPIVPSLAAMITTVAARDGQSPPPVRMFTNTGAALPAATVSALRMHFPGAKVVRQFGQTECKRIAIMPPDEELDRPDSVGRPLPGTTVQILDPDGEPLPVGEVGEIVVSGPHVMPGYWRAPEITGRTFALDERTGVVRLHTGDYGSLDADGYLYFDGRRDDMFKRKGIRVSTLEIESAAMDIPGVCTAAAIPPADGRDLALVVESELDGHAVLVELARRLEPAKVPAICHVVADLPLTLHGKNSRKDLVALLEKAGR